jgi:AcrR family transcriptional regulator
MPKATNVPPRRRLGAEAARELILDATEKRLIAGGPSGIRLQEVAAEAGVSHPTVLHHFGSRERLVEATIARSLEAINAGVIAAIRASSGDEEHLEEIMENVARTMARTGHGRVMMWLALEGSGVEGGDGGLRNVVEAAHAMRLARKKHARKATREDTARTVVLAALVLVAGSVLAPKLLENAGLGGDERAAAGFRRWFARLVADHVDG